MHRASVLQVAYHHDVDIVEPSLRLFDREEVKQRLARVLVRAVACIDDRHFGNFTCVAGRSFDIVAHDDHVAIIRNDRDRVVERFTFRYTGVRRVRKSDDASAQVVDRTFETEPRAGGRFKEERCDNFAGKHLLVRIGFEARGKLHDLEYFVA